GASPITSRVSSNSTQTYATRKYQGKSGFRASSHPRVDAILNETLRCRPAPFPKPGDRGACFIVAGRETGMDSNESARKKPTEGIARRAVVEALSATLLVPACAVTTGDDSLASGGLAIDPRDPVVPPEPTPESAAFPLGVASGDALPTSI